MAEECESIMKDDVWEVILRLEGNSVVTLKWLYKIKHGVAGCFKKYRAIFVARGFYQKGEDYDDPFAPISYYTTIRSIVALTASQGWTLHQMDVKTMFLHGIIKEEVYVEHHQDLGSKTRRPLCAR